MSDDSGCSVQNVNSKLANFGCSKPCKTSTAPGTLLCSRQWLCSLFCSQRSLKNCSTTLITYSDFVREFSLQGIDPKCPCLQASTSTFKLRENRTFDWQITSKVQNLSLKNGHQHALDCCCENVETVNKRKHRHVTPYKLSVC